ncbi:helix-turn-helix domain-containing protein [Nocardia neocaledoniensis]|uniref:MmyB family transcriptional regulator n=1 Tax=Nocardia neocaledoniensis TaxID=236511 RepID=UPI0024584278|nr:helix-turn-helix domain-containing protein [Nocardia neocaledoniensis]
MKQLTRSGEGAVLAAPSFGSFLRGLRDDRRLSRERLAMSAGVSASYITHLEWGDRDHPARAVVEALVACLDRVRPLRAAERRHLFDLAGLPITATPTVDQLRAGIGPDALRNLDAHGGRIAGYFDSRGNILALNSATRTMLPGLGEGANLLHWLFGDPLAQRVVLNWDEVARSSVSGLRGRIGAVGQLEWAERLLGELGTYAEFRALWTLGEVTFSTGSSPIRLRDPATGRAVDVLVQVFDVDIVDYPGWVRVFLGV